MHTVLRALHTRCCIASSNICISHAPSVRRLFRPHRITKNDKHLASSNKWRANNFLLAAPDAFKVSCFCFEIIFFLSQNFSIVLILDPPVALSILNESDILHCITGSFFNDFCRAVGQLHKLFAITYRYTIYVALKTNCNKRGTRTQITQRLSTYEVFKRVVKFCPVAEQLKICKSQYELSSRSKYKVGSG